MLKHLNKTLQITMLLTFIVIILGAYTRLKDAGLGCPDWPGCYGKIFAPLETKAWIEMIHRYVAGTLSILILYLAVQGIRLRTVRPKLWLLTSALFCLVIFQALLGMWTVTLKLNPLVVMGHLLGGFAILVLLWCTYLSVKSVNTSSQVANNYKYLRIFTVICLTALSIQIALGGWTSANYAALVCADFPTCQGQIWPPMDWNLAFAWPGVALENTPRVTIQMAHRIGALITTILCGGLALILLQIKTNKLKLLGILLLMLLGSQVVLGISNVLAGLPVAVSLAHSAMAVMLLLCLTYIFYTLNVQPTHS